jgi:putative Ca2+/H+ antiporter (TMEM165/GDT1 family)
VDALLTSFIAAGLGEFGDRTQLLAALLAARFGRPGTVLAGIGLGALVHMLLAGFAGAFANDFILPASASLLVALALAYAGVMGFFARSLPVDAGTGKDLFWAALGGAFALEFADKSQFLTLGLAARTDSVVLTAAGATAGILAACLPAALLGARFEGALPMKPIRIGIAVAFTLAAFLVAVNALGLV